MEITSRDLFTSLHGMGLGALFLLAFSGALVELYRISMPAGPTDERHAKQWLVVYLVAMAILAWLTVLTGTYQIYPWYRAVPPEGATDLAEYPRRLLLSSGRTSQWHNIGMEWKEHVAWLAPIAITTVAYVLMRYGRAITQHRTMRVAVLIFTIAAFAAIGIAGAFGAFLNKYAPTGGGQVIILMGEGK